MREVFGWEGGKGVVKEEGGGIRTERMKWVGGGRGVVGREEGGKGWTGLNCPLPEHCCHTEIAARVFVCLSGDADHFLVLYLPPGVCVRHDLL